MSFSIPGYWEETTPGDRLRADIDARLRRPMQPMANPDVLGKLLPSEPVETVTSTTGDLVDLAKAHGVDEGVFVPSDLAPDELRDASRMAHEALGLEASWPCAECKASFERNTGLIKEHLARYSEALDEIDAMNGQNPFSAFAADPLSLRVKALLAEMREEGARIRAERGEAG